MRILSNRQVKEQEAHLAHLTGEMEGRIGTLQDELETTHQQAAEMEGRIGTLQTELETTHQQLAAISIRIDDSPGWSALNAAPGDRDYSEYYADLVDADEAWRKNFFIRRIVNTTRGYVVGDGIEISSDIQAVQTFITAFWNHEKNHLTRRLGQMCDQLTRDGELFPLLFTDPETGISFIRFRTARQIREIETLGNDWEEERFYIESDDWATGKRWMSIRNPRAEKKHKSGNLPPVMLHWSVNRPINALRGESDLTPILPWAKRYSEWLSDRVRINRQRTRQAMMLIQMQEDGLVELKSEKMRGVNPIEAGVYVYGPGEEVEIPALNINAPDAEADGHALRLAIAAGSNIGLHFLGEGEGTNYATAKEMGEPTARFFTERQHDFIWMLEELIAVAYNRFQLVHNQPPTPAIELKLEYSVTEVARTDNATLATAARDVATAFATAAAQGWIDRQTAAVLMLKFAGETISQDDIAIILAKAGQERETERKIAQEAQEAAQKAMPQKQEQEQEPPK